METKILTCLEDFDEAGRAIKNGAVVVYPTDTVYGLGCNPFSELAVARCFTIKGRDLEKAMPVLFSSKSEAGKIVEFSDLADQVARRFWPGRVTMILPLRGSIELPDQLTGRGRNLAVRVPDHECARSLINASGGSLVGTSANLSGMPSLKNEDDPSLAEIASKCDFFVKGKCGGFGVALSSTVIDLAVHPGKATVTREGAVPLDEILSYLDSISNADFSNNRFRS